MGEHMTRCDCMWDCKHEWCECAAHSPMTMTISIAEQAHQDDLRARSIQLAVERGHLRNG